MPPNNTVLANVKAVGRIFGRMLAPTLLALTVASYSDSEEKNLKEEPQGKNIQTTELKIEEVAPVKEKYDDLYLDFMSEKFRDTGGRKIAEIKFGVAADYVPIKSERCKGAIPKSVQEDSAWAKVWMDYRHMIDDMGGGLSWLRAEVKRCESGAGQLKIKLPPEKRASDYRLMITASSPTNSILSVKIMQEEKPYKTYWMKNFGLAGERRTLRSDFRLDAIEVPHVMIISFGKSGVFDLFNVQLEAKSETDIREEMDRRHPDGGPENIVRNSQFSLGLQSGWTAGVNCSTELDIDMLPSPEDSDPTRGSVPMRFRTKSDRGHIRLFSAPFEVPLSYKPHCLSFYVKGECNGKLKIFCDGEELAQKDISVSAANAFDRIEIPFKPVLNGKFHVFSLEAKGDFLLDAIMVNPGDAAKPFVFHRGSEISLALDFSSNNTIFLDNKDDRHIICEIRGSWPDDAKIAIRKYNAYGDVGGEPNVQLPPSSGKAFSFKINSAPANLERPLGAQRIEASLIGADGKLLGPVQELVYHVLNRPKYWGKDAPLRSPFGIHCNVFEPHIFSAKALGANWVRTHGPNGFLTYWSACEHKKGSFSFKDNYVGLFLKKNLRILGVLAECPGWARVTRPSGGAWLDNWWQPRDFAEFGNYAYMISSHFKGRIDHWEIWNEPWGGFWFKEWDAAKTGAERWSRGNDPLGDYLNLSKIAYEQTKRGNPACTVIGVNGTTWGGGRGEDWMGKMLQAGGLEYCDVASFHSYHNDSAFFGSMLNQNSMWTEKFMQNVIESFRKFPKSGSKALWMTEGKSSEQSRNSSLYRHTVLFNTDNAELINGHAALLPVYHAVMFSEGVDKIFVYSMEATGFKPINGIDWSVLTTKSGELNVSADAYATMTYLLEDAKFAGRLTLGAGWHAFVFKTPATAAEARTVAMLAGENSDMIPFPKISECEYFDIFGNRISLDSKPHGLLGYIVANGDKVQQIMESLR